MKVTSRRFLLLSNKPLLAFGIAWTLNALEFPLFDLTTTGWHLVVDRASKGLWPLDVLATSIGFIPWLTTRIVLRIFSRRAYWNQAKEEAVGAASTSDSTGKIQ